MRNTYTRVTFNAAELADFLARALIVGATAFGFTLLLCWALADRAVTMYVRTTEEQCGALYAYWSRTYDDSASVAFTHPQCAVFAVPAPPSPQPEPQPR